MGRGRAFLLGTLSGAVEPLAAILTVLLSGALTLTILVFRKTGNRAYQLMSVYFATLLLAELFARDAEIRGMIYTLLANIFHAASILC